MPGPDCCRPLPFAALKRVCNELLFRASHASLLSRPLPICVSVHVRVFDIQPVCAPLFAAGAGRCRSPKRARVNCSSRRQCRRGVFAISACPFFVLPARPSRAHVRGLLPSASALWPKAADRNGSLSVADGTQGIRPAPDRGAVHSAEEWCMLAVRVVRVWLVLSAPRRRAGSRLLSCYSAPSSLRLGLFRTRRMGGDVGAGHAQRLGAWHHTCVGSDCSCPRTCSSELAPRAPWGSAASDGRRRSLAGPASSVCSQLQSVSRHYTPWHKPTSDSREVAPKHHCAAALLRFHLQQLT
jgi:hypothetical protein